MRDEAALPRTMVQPMAETAPDPITPVRLPLSKALARAKEVMGSLELAQAPIVRWLTSVSDPLRFGAHGIDGILPGEVLKGMPRKQAEAEALRNLFGPGQFSIEWEEDWVRRQDGVFVFTVYGFRVDAEDFEARLSTLSQVPLTKAASSIPALAATSNPSAPAPRPFPKSLAKKLAGKRGMLPVARALWKECPPKGKAPISWTGKECSRRLTKYCDKPPHPETCRRTMKLLGRVAG
jgi:hypothetical protein